MYLNTLSHWLNVYQNATACERHNDLLSAINRALNLASYARRTIAVGFDDCDAGLWKLINPENETTDTIVFLVNPNSQIIPLNSGEALLSQFLEATMSDKDQFFQLKEFDPIQPICA